MKHSTVFMLFIDLMINLALNIGVKSFFFKEFGTHSFNFINLDKDSFRFIQLHSSSSFNSLFQIYLFITPLLRHLPYLSNEYVQFPTVFRYTTAQKYGRKAEQQKGCTQQTGINAVVGFFFLFSSSKSLSTPDFFLMVIKNTLMVSQRHSLDLE